MVAYVLIALRTPHGQWDGWAIWNSKARLFYYNDPLLVLQISGLPHKDYPPLLSLVVTYGYRLFGDTPLVPIIIHGAVLVGVLWLSRLRLWALVIVGAVAVAYAPTQFADLPLALCFLGAVVAYRHDKPLWVGFALGCGMLIKNEGALIAAVFIGVWVVSTHRIPWKTLAVLAPFLICLVLYKSVVNVSNDIVGSSGAFDRLTDLSRYPVMIPLLISGLVDFGGGALLVLVAGIFLQQKPVKVSLPLFVSAIVFMGYVGIYAITPADLIWHIGSSWDRLLLQLFPVTVYELTRQ